MLTIRLRRSGAKKDAHYRVVVADRSAGRDGPFLEIVGHYHPRRQPAEIVLDVERTESWLQRGARMSETVRGLYRSVKSGRVASSPEPESIPEVSDEQQAEAAAPTTPEASDNLAVETADEPASVAEESPADPEQPVQGD